jgi:hypothetical protein
MPTNRRSFSGSIQKNTPDQQEKNAKQTFGVPPHAYVTIQPLARTGLHPRLTAVCQRNKGCIKQEFLFENRDNPAVRSIHGITATCDECSETWQAA